MKRIVFLLSALSVLSFAATGYAEEIAVCKTGDPFPYTAAGDVPCAADIQAYMDRLNACTHFQGEEGYDAERAAFLKQKMDELKCADIICDYAALGASYEGDIYYSRIVHDYTAFVLGDLPDTEHCNAAANSAGEGEKNAD